MVENVLIQNEACGRGLRWSCKSHKVLLICHSLGFLIFAVFAIKCVHRNRFTHRTDMPCSARRKQRKLQNQSTVTNFHNRLLSVGAVWAALSWITSLALVAQPCADTRIVTGLLITHYMLRGVRVFLFVAVFIFLSAESAGRLATVR